MINYNKNELINECLAQYYETFSRTLDTADYVPEKFNKKIMAYIFKNMKRQFRKLDSEDKKYQKECKKMERAKRRESKKLKSGVKNDGKEKE